jgi:hypothetical protein
MSIYDFKTNFELPDFDLNCKYYFPFPKKTENQNTFQNFILSAIENINDENKIICIELLHYGDLKLFNEPPSPIFASLLFFTNFIKTVKNFEIKKTEINETNLSNNYIIISGATKEEYKYKDFNTQTEILFLNPSQGQYVIYPPNNLLKPIGELADKNTLILSINIYENPVEIELIEWSIFENYNTPIIFEKYPLENTEILTDKLNEKMLKPLIFENDAIEIIKIIKNTKIKKNSIIKLKLFQKKENNCLKIYNDFKQINNLMVNNRFLQRLSGFSVFSKEISEWIIFETIQYGVPMIHSEYTEYMIEFIPGISTFLFRQLKSIILPKITELYQLPDKLKINVTKFNVLKYFDFVKIKNKINCDEYTINILLSNTKYEIHFNDNIITKLGSGDCIGYVSSSVNEITIEPETFMVILNYEINYEDN